MEIQGVLLLNALLAPQEIGHTMSNNLLFQMDLSVKLNLPFLPECQTGKYYHGFKKLQTPVLYLW